MDEWFKRSTKAVAIKARTVDALIELKNCVSIAVASDVTGVRSLRISINTTRPRRTEITSETRSTEPGGKRNEMHESRNRRTEGKIIAMIPEPTARSTVPDVSPGRGLVIPHGYLHPGKSKHSEV